MSKQTKPLPKFKNEAEERAFWETKGKDSTEFLDWKEAQRAVLPNLKPSKKTTSLRLTP
ncbi:MAG: CopG family antitoxin [Rugosibacter sp.]